MCELETWLSEVVGVGVLGAANLYSGQDRAETRAVGVCYSGGRRVGGVELRGMWNVEGG